MNFFDFNFCGLREQIQVMDVGASAINEVPAYTSLLENGLAHLSAFEGDARQIENIKRTYGTRSTIYREFLFDGTEQTLYVASPESGMSSLYKPRRSALEFFNGFEFFGAVEKTIPVKTKKLDSIAELPSIDLLKMDIQGAELTVLKHGTNKLKDCLAIQLEVSYTCLYEDQPPFGEVDVWLRSQGYVPHCFLEVKRWSIKPTIFDGNFRVPGNQLLESDVVYVRDPLDLDRLTDVQILKLMTIAHHCFKSYDLVGFLVIALERRGSIRSGAYQEYVAALAQPGA